MPDNPSPFGMSDDPGGPPPGGFGSPYPPANPFGNSVPPSNAPGAWGAGAQNQWGPFDPASGGAPAGSAPGFGAQAGGGVGHPPVVWLLVSIALGAVAAVVAALLGATPLVAFGCWAAAGPIAVGMLAVYSVRDTAQRARPIYTSAPWTTSLYVAATVAVGIGIVASALRIAQWAGRL